MEMEIVFYWGMGERCLISEWSSIIYYQSEYENYEEGIQDSNNRRQNIKLLTYSV